MPEFYHKLDFQRRMVLLFLLFVFVFSLLGGFSLAALIAAGFDSLWPWHERSAWLLFNALMLICGVVFIGGIYLILKRRPGVVDLARLVERRHPELKESLSTAVEVIDRCRERQEAPNAIEAALLRQVERDTEAINFRRATLPRHFHPALAFVLVVGSLMLVDFMSASQIARKAQYYQQDKLHGSATGLIVKPGDIELPIGSELVIRAEVNRWERGPVIILREDGQTVRYPMMLDEDGVGQFTLFDLREDTEYRVETSSLGSPTYSVKLYDPPTIDAVEIEIVPPAYTRMEPLAYSKLLDLFPVEGSTITFTLTTSPGTMTVFKLGEENLGFDHSVTMTAAEDTTYQFALTNQENRKAVTGSHVIEVTPDEPPVADVLDPGEDTRAGLNGIIPLELYGGDDFGLARVELHASVSGLPRRPIVVYTADPEDEPLLERQFLTQLEIRDLSAEHGDIVSYYFTVADNREPEPNVVQTDIFFVEVSADIESPEPEPSEGGGEGEGEQREVDIRSIIVELKRVIRESHRAGILQDEAREKALQQLGTDLNNVELETRKLLSEIGQTLAMVEGGEFYLMMQNALERMVEAEQEINGGRPLESIPLQEEALSDLLKLESYIKANSPPTGGMPSQGEPQQGESGQQGQQSEQKQHKDALSMAEMQAMMSDLNRLADDQAGQNQRYDRAARTSPGQSELNQLGQSQSSLQSGTTAQGESISGLPGYGPLTREIEEAAGYMEDATQAIESGDADRAGSAGARANEALLNAISMLDERIRQEASGQLQGLATQAEALATQQSEAAQASEDADASGDADRKAMHADQLALNDEFATLLNELQQAASELGQQYPQVGEALTRASREANQSGTQPDMQRAANALLYGRYGKAGELQTDAAEGLDELAGQLRDAGDMIPAMSPAELQGLLDEVQRAREAARQAQQQGQQGQQPGEGEDGQSEQIGRLGSSLEQAGQRLKDPTLSELGERLSAPEGSGGSSESGGKTDVIGDLDNAASILQQYLRIELVDERIRYKRQSAPPPEQYRHLVEEYFKDLAEEP